MRALIVLVYLLTSGCAYYLTPRPPVMERKLGRPGNESVGALATAADYRLVYVQINPTGKVCAEPPPDAAGQFAAMFAAAVTGPMKKATLDANTQASLAVSMKQLFRRSQGVQFYRDATFTLCNLYMNDAISKERYVAELQALRTSAEALIAVEIPYMGVLSFDPVAAPALIPISTEAKEKKSTPDGEEKPSADPEKESVPKPEEKPSPDPDE